MNRRAFLTRSAVVLGVASCSGCNERALKGAKSQPPPLEDTFEYADLELPVAQKFEVAADGVRRAEDSTVEDRRAFETFLEGAELSVELLEETTEDGTELLELEYVDERAVDRGLFFGVGVVSGGYAALVAGGYSGAKLVATVRDDAGTAYGEFEVETELAEAYREGGESAAAYASDVGDTFESV